MRSCAGPAYSSTDPSQDAPTVDHADHTDHTAPTREDGLEHSGQEYVSALTVLL